MADTLIIMCTLPKFNGGMISELKRYRSSVVVPFMYLLLCSDNAWTLNCSRSKFSLLSGGSHLTESAVRASWMYRYLHFVHLNIKWHVGHF